MTKEKLRRYFELDQDYENSGRLDPGGPPDGPRLLEYEALAREFEAWEPDRERDAARGVARHLLYLVEHLPECYTSEIRQMRRDIGWLGVEVRPVMQYLPIEEPDGSSTE